MVIRYSDIDFKTIEESGFVYSLSDDVLAIIKNLTEKVGNPEYVRTPQFNKRQNQDGWDKFKKTEIIKKEGFEASIDIIRKHLNKMTDKTYHKLSEKVIEEIINICKTNNIPIDDPGDVPNDIITENSDINKLGEVIFTIASSSSFYSELYSKFYLHLMKRFSFMSLIFKNNFNQFQTVFHSIDYCSPNEDYDQFCDNNKNNEKRRALGLFYVNLTLHNAISLDELFAIITRIQDYMNNLIAQEEKKEIVDELSELIFIMTSNILKSKEDYSENSMWKNIVKNIRDIAKLKNKMYPSITNKTIFKHLDIVDILDS